MVDAESRNGTSLNGAKLVARQPHVIRNGDHLRLGDVDLHFHDPSRSEKLVGSSSGRKT